MDAMTVFNLMAGFASIVSLAIAISAKADVKNIKHQKMEQKGKRNKQAGRDINE